MLSDNQAQDQNQETQNKEVSDALRTKEELRHEAIEAISQKDQATEEGKTEEEIKQDEKKNGGLDPRKLAISNARLEKQLRDMRSEIDEYKKTKESYESILNKLKDPESRYNLIEEHGGNLSEWTDRVVQGGQPQKDERDLRLEQMEQTIFDLKDSLSKRSEEEQNATNQQRLEETRTYAKNFVTENEGYEFTATLNQSDRLIQEAVRRQNEGIPIDDHEIAQEIEKQTVELLKKQLSDLSKIKKFDEFMSDLGYVRQQIDPKKEPTQRDRDQGNKTETEFVDRQTLTNDLSADPGDVFDYKANHPPEILRDHAIKAAERIAQRNKDRYS